MGIILKLNLEKSDEKAWTEVMWLRTETNTRLL
jgi:hypothetical protein